MFNYPVSYLSCAYFYKQHYFINLLWLTSSINADNGALMIGKKFGKTKFMPAFSPTKTWEGVFGAVLFSTLTGCLFVVLNQTRILFLGDVNPLHIVAMSFLIGVTSVFGDLVESFMKRCAGVKDAGVRLPGHGGFLDRVFLIIID